MARITTLRQSNRQRWFCLAVLVLIAAVSGCENNSQQQSRRTQQALNAAKTKSDALRDAMRYLEQMTPLNRNKVALEVQLHLNKWWLTADKSKRASVPNELIDGLPPALRSDAGAVNQADGQFDVWDVEYLYQCRLYQKLSSWIISRPLRDSLLVGWLEKQASALPPGEFAHLEQACKLFDWSVRNIVLEGDAGDVEKLLDDPRKPLSDNGVGYSYLPWQTILYARGDFLERGRVFTSLAQQRELQTCWVALRLPSSPSAKIWCVAVLVGDNCYLFDPKLGLPILHPDTAALASLTEVQRDERILRRLDVPGRFDYAVNAGDAAKVELLFESEPSSITDRMATLQASLTGEDRLLLQPDLNALQQKLKRIMPNAPVAIWQTPLLARLYATDLRNRLEMNSPFTAQYMIEHAVWFLNTPSATARLKHLAGEFENTLDSRGALASYMDCILPDDLINRLPDDPDVQRELAIPRMNTESMEEYQARLKQYQMVFRTAKVDVSFLLGQLHYDVGDYDSVEGWLRKRTLSKNQAARWHAAARYTLGRAYQEQGKIAEAAALFSEDGSPMEAGNRLRVRFLQR